MGKARDKDMGSGHFTNLAWSLNSQNLNISYNICYAIILHIFILCITPYYSIIWFFALYIHWYWYHYMQNVQCTSFDIFHCINLLTSFWSMHFLSFNVFDELSIHLIHFLLFILIYALILMHFSQYILFYAFIIFIL